MATLSQDVAGNTVQQKLAEVLANTTNQPPASLGGQADHNGLKAMCSSKVEHEPKRAGRSQQAQERSSQEREAAKEQPARKKPRLQAELEEVAEAAAIQAAYEAEQAALEAATKARATPSAWAATSRKLAQWIANEARRKAVAAVDRARRITEHAVARESAAWEAQTLHADYGHLLAEEELPPTLTWKGRGLRSRPALKRSSSRELDAALMPPPAANRPHSPAEEAVVRGDTLASAAAHAADESLQKPHTAPVQTTASAALPTALDASLQPLQQVNSLQNGVAPSASSGQPSAAQAPGAATSAQVVQHGSQARQEEAMQPLAKPVQHSDASAQQAAVQAPAPVDKHAVAAVHAPEVLHPSNVVYQHEAKQVPANRPQPVAQAVARHVYPTQNSSMQPQVAPYAAPQSHVQYGGAAVNAVVVQPGSSQQQVVTTYSQAAQPSTGTQQLAPTYILPANTQQQQQPQRAWQPIIMQQQVVPVLGYMMPQSCVVSAAQPAILQHQPACNALMAPTIRQAEARPAPAASGHMQRAVAQQTVAANAPPCVQPPQHQRAAQRNPYPALSIDRDDPEVRATELQPGRYVVMAAEGQDAFTCLTLTPNDMESDGVEQPCWVGRVERCDGGQMLMAWWARTGHRGMWHPAHSWPEAGNLACHDWMECSGQGVLAVFESFTEDMQIPETVLVEAEHRLGLLMRMEQGEFLAQAQAQAQQTSAQPVVVA